MNEVLSIVPWAAPWGLGEKEEAGTSLEANLRRTGCR
jgi:hypothetical protein